MTTTPDVPPGGACTRVESQQASPHVWVARCPIGWAEVERIATNFLGIVNLGFAVAILVGGAVRFPPPTYEPLLALTHGQVWPYGLLFLVSGVALVGCPNRVGKIVGAVLGVIANSTFAALFLVAVVQYADAGATAWWAYFAFSTLNAAIAALMWTHRGARGPGK